MINLNNDFKEIKNFRNIQSNLTEESAIYIFVSENPISRLVGESNILKIGETNNLRRRMTRYFRVNDISTIKDKASRQTAYHIRNYLDNKSSGYVKLLVKYCNKENLKKEEKELINLYLKEHFEVPPLNMSRK